MNEEKIMQQIVASQIGMHPLIQECTADFDMKLKMQMMLDGVYDGDLKTMMLDMLKFMIEDEEYEFAAVLRDEFINKL
jgi:hypothetical protein